MEQFNRLRRRAADLQELCRAMAVFHSEIGWRQADLSAIAAEHEEIAFFRRWDPHKPVDSACLNASVPMALSAADRRVLREFAEGAGRMDRAGQLAQLERTCRQLEKQAAEAREELKNKGRVQLVLALCVGGTVSLLLL